jgi:hypothetical protein
MPNAVISSAALVAQYRDASRKKGGGNLCFNVPHRIARPDRLAILEVWRIKQPRRPRQSREGLAPPRRTQDDSECTLRPVHKNRIHVELVNSDSRAGTIYVLTHVDLTPGHPDDCLALLRIMSVHRDPRRRDEIEWR